MGNGGGGGVAVMGDMASIMLITRGGVLIHGSTPEKCEIMKSDTLLPGVSLFTWCVILFACVCVLALVYPPADQ
jgi:hypothetical protein